MAEQNYEAYQADVSKDIAACLESMNCQPILFIGAGLSIRYFGAPGWIQLLQHLAKECPNVERDFAYYWQSLVDPIKIGSAFVGPYMEWAWGKGRNHFDSDLYTPERAKDIFLKFAAASYIASRTPSLLADVSSNHAGEIAALQKIAPHAIITTNYDTFSELLFPNHEAIIGQKVIRYNHSTIGEIFKVHGCVTRPETMILTEEDYQDFNEKRKYLSAKLLAYFAEHPLLIVGYSASDPNIRQILADIGEILAGDGELIPNIYMLEWDPELTADLYPAREKLIAINAKSLRVKSIVASSFEWVFEAFGADQASMPVNPKTLRSVMARSFELFRCDVPRRKVEVDFELLERAANQDGELAKLYGITLIDNADALNVGHPFILSDISKALGGKKWHRAHELIEKVRKTTGVDIKATDNVYHIGVKTGNCTITHKYSQKLMDLLTAVRAGAPYKLEIEGVANEPDLASTKVLTSSKSECHEGFTARRAS
jgi:hypothetical protein